MKTAQIKSIKGPFRNAALNPGGEFELALSLDQMKDILDTKTLTMTLDPKESYDKLSAGNQRALAHLVRAADILNDVFLKQDDADNIRARNILRREAATGNETAIDALAIFTMHNGMEGKNMYAQKSEPLYLFKNKQGQQGRALYPKGITEDEVAAYVVDHPEQASALLGNNTIVRRKGNGLTAIPYSVAFAKEMTGAAKELLAAARETDHDGLADYLRWHAQALVNDADPEMMYRADKAWVGLEDSPLEFTIGRESYDDDMSKAVAARPEVAKVLAANGVKTKAKDMIGVRVGIVSTESIEKIAGYRRHMPAFADSMPRKEQYAEQAGNAGEQKMTYADVDLVAMSGDYAAVRGGITVAQNLPNGDKLAVQLKEGNRLVFHRDVRRGADPDQRRKFMDSLIGPEQHHLYVEDADFLFTIGHELAHSLGPKDSLDGRDKKSSLGKSGDIIEENKADVKSISMSDEMAMIFAREAAFVVGFGPVDEKSAEELVQSAKDKVTEAYSIYLTWAAKLLPTKQPSPDEAHRVRSIMQFNYFREKGAIQFEAGGKLSIVPEKMAPVAREMLDEVIGLQLEGNAEKAASFVDKYAAWNDALQYAVDEKMKLKPKLYRMLDQPMRNRLLSPN